MVNKKLLDKQLSSFSYNREDIKKINYNKSIENMIINLFDEYNDYIMEKQYYCCNGLTRYCWIEIIEEGNWNMTLEQVKIDISYAVKKSRKYLYNSKRYGTNRVHMYKDNDECYIFIYLRDIIGVDYNIWFEKIENIDETQH